jgi:hypothetical protein
MISGTNKNSEAGHEKAFPVQFKAKPILIKNKNFN